MGGRGLDVVVFGEAMAMFVAEQDGPLDGVRHYTRAMAGAEVNVAVGLARLGYAVGWIGRLGRDPFGRFIASELAGAGVDLGRVGWDGEFPTGFQLKGRMTAGDPEVVYFRKGSAGSRLSFTDADARYIAGARHLHVTGIPPALSETAREFTRRALATAAAAGLPTTFDPNLRPSLWPDAAEMRVVLDELARRASWVLPGLAEGRALTGLSDEHDIAAHYLRRGAAAVAVKLGAQGAAVHTAQGRVAAPPYPVRVVDTVGAGDGFAVGVISGLLDGLPPEGCLSRANAVGALAVSARGDSEGLPTRAALDAFVAAVTRRPDAPDPAGAPTVASSTS